MEKVLKKEYKNISLLKAFKDLNIPIKAKHYEPNPKRKDNKYDGMVIYSRNDCSTRAMSKVLNLPYEKIFDRQCELAKIYYVCYNHMLVLDNIMVEHGYIYKELPEECEQSLLAFMMTHLKGHYMLISEDHAVAYIDGTIYDNFDSKMKDNCFNWIACKDLYGWYEPMAPFIVKA